MPNSFMGFCQNFGDKTSTSLKISAVVTCPVHIVLINFSEGYRRILVSNRHTLIGFLPVTCDDN